MYDLKKFSGDYIEDISLDFFDETYSACIYDSGTVVEKDDILIDKENSKKYIVKKVDYYMSFRTILSHYYVELRPIS